MMGTGSLIAGEAIGMLQGMDSRVLAGIAVGGQAAFIAAWVVGGFVEPDYSTARQTVSELFSRAADHRWIVQSGLLALVPSYLAAAELARRRVGAVTAGLLALAAPLVVGVLLTPLDCMSNAGESCPAPAHYAFAVTLQLTLSATPFTAAWALRGRPGARIALAAGGLGLAGIAWFAVAGDPTHGIAQRAMFATVTVWIAVLASRVGSRQ
jgi:hypothetical protein